MSEVSSAMGKPRAFDVIFFGWLAIGFLDMLDAWLFFGNFYNITFFQVFQSVAGGIYGPQAARAGGVTMGLIGLALHYVVALGVAVVFYLLCTRLTFLYKQPWIWGPIYGIVAHFVMQYVVIPNSAIGRYPATIFDWPSFNGIVGHALIVGLPVALIAHWSARRNTRV